MWFLDMAMATTGTPVDTILGNVKVLIGGLISTGAGVILGYKGLRHMSDEGGGHFSAGSLSQLVPGVALAGGGFPVALYLMGGAGGMPLDVAAIQTMSLVGDFLSANLSPLAPMPWALLYMYWRRQGRKRHG